MSSKSPEELPHKAGRFRKMIGLLCCKTVKTDKYTASEPHGVLVTTDVSVGSRRRSQFPLRYMQYIAEIHVEASNGNELSGKKEKKEKRGEKEKKAEEKKEKGHNKLKRKRHMEAKGKT